MIVQDCEGQRPAESRYGQVQQPKQKHHGDAAVLLADGVDADATADPVYAMRALLHLSS